MENRCLNNYAEDKSASYSSLIEVCENTNNTRAFVSKVGCYIPILLFGNGKDLKSERFNPENIRKALTSKDEVLVLFSSVHYNDNELTKLNDGTTYKLNKTWEDLGLQDLYEEYLKSK